MTTATEPEAQPGLPTLETTRLVLRPWFLDDARTMQQLAGDKSIARFTRVPHPYPDGAAENFIGSHGESFATGKGLVLAITLRESGAVVGCIGLHGDFSTGIAELGYWVGAAYWGKGYCTEAARAIVDYGFRALKLARIHSRHLGKNPASGRVMQKLGMLHEGRRRQHLFRWGEYDDEVLFGMLKAEFDLVEAHQ